MDDGNVCEHRLIDNATWRIRPNGHVNCDGPVSWAAQEATRNSAQRMEAIRAAGVLHDAPAALQLLPLLRSALSGERLAAAQTLAELCLRQHVTALGTAAAQEPVATAPAMKQSLERLMTCRLEPAPMAPVWPALPR